MALPRFDSVEIVKLRVDEKAVTSSSNKEGENGTLFRIKTN